MIISLPNSYQTPYKLIFGDYNLTSEVDFSIDGAFAVHYFVHFSTSPKKFMSGWETTTTKRIFFSHRKTNDSPSLVVQL
jgi:hypothetical protein